MEPGPEQPGIRAPGRGNGPQPFRRRGVQLLRAGHRQHGGAGQIRQRAAERAMAQTENIYNTTLEIFRVADEENIPTYLAANRMAERRIESIANVHRGF